MAFATLSFKHLKKVNQVGLTVVHRIQDHLKIGLVKL
jgi:hypothetical protein